MSIILRDCDEKKYDFTLIVADSGAGFPEDIDFRNSGSFGLHIIIALIKQLRGVINLDRTGGTTFTIKFKTPTYIE